MKTKQFREVTVMLLAILIAFNFSALNLLADAPAPVTIATVTAVLGNHSKVSLSCSSDGAFIMYSINEGEYAEYNPSEQVTLDTFPICLKAYAEMNGQTGDISTFNFIQAQVRW